MRRAHLPHDTPIEVDTVLSVGPEDVAETR